MQLLHGLHGLSNNAEVDPQKIALVLDDQAWTYAELTEKIGLIARHLYGMNVNHGQIIYQFVERSLEMIAGIFGIMHVGGIYCPLNPTDPSDRIQGLIQQTQGQYALIQERTRQQFPTTLVQQVVSLEEILGSTSENNNVAHLPNFQEDGFAVIILTSGTTGQSKAVVHTHRSYAASNAAYANWNTDMYTHRDQVLQVAACSWLVHLTEVSVPLAVGGCLVLLRPGGLLNMNYFCHVLKNQKVSTLTIGPALVRALVRHFEVDQQYNVFKHVQNICVAGINYLFSC